MSNDRVGFWIVIDSGSVPTVYGYECSCCRSFSREPRPQCDVCGARMSDLIVQSLWTDFGEEK